MAVTILYVRHGAAPIRAPVPSVVIPPVDSLFIACDIAGITKDDVRGGSRNPAICLKRHHVCWQLYQWGRSQSQIGKMINRERTSVLHSIRKWDEHLGSLSNARAELGGAI